MLSLSMLILTAYLEAALDATIRNQAETWPSQNEIILDFKTTENVRRFPQAVKYDSSYDTQAYIYQQIFKLPFVFVVVGNTQKQYADGTKYYEIGIHAATDEVILRGKNKTLEAIKRYKGHMDGTRNVKRP